MKKNATKKNNKSSKTSTTSQTPAAPKAAKATKNGPGRPLYVPKFPRKDEWTMNDFCKANSVDVETGKGPNCSKLTLIKWMARDKARKGRSLVKRLDHTAPPSSENGLGRKAFLFSLREKLAPGSDVEAPAPVTAEVPAVNEPVTTDAPAPGEASVDVSEATKSYEATKAALLGTSVPITDIAAPAPQAEPVIDAEAVPAV